MKLKVFLLPALLSAALFAQDPNGFGGRPGDFGNRGFNDDGPPGDFGPGARRGMGMRGRMGMRDGMGMRGRMGPREFALGRLLNDPNIRQQIGVTADQAAKIRQQQSDFRKAEIRNRADLEIKRLDLRDLLAADKPDRAAIDSKLQEVGAAQTAMEKSAIDYRLNMRDALTPAQREKLRQLMTQRRPFAPGANAAPRGPQAGPGAGGPGRGRGGRGAAPAPNTPAPPARPNQQ
jgi:Spy/CpxP family protein refolding chaperone